MPDPQSPFDETVEASAPEEQAGFELPLRKWSFVALGVVLFALVWIREFTRMPPELTITAAVVVIVCWGIAHIAIYTPVPPRISERSGDELAESKPNRGSGRAVRVVGAIGLLTGIWLQAMMPMSPLELTIVVLFVLAFIYGSAQLASRL